MADYPTARIMFQAMDARKPKPPMPHNGRKSISQKPKIMSKEVVVTNVDRLGSHIGEVTEAVAASIAIPEERVFYDPAQYERADKLTTGRARPVRKMKRDYEHEVAKAEEEEAKKKKKKRRSLKRPNESHRGHSVRKESVRAGGTKALVEGYEALERQRKKIEKEAKLTKIDLAAEKERKLAEIEEEEARRKKEHHEEMKRQLMEKKEEILEQEHDEMMSHLAEKKESIVEEEFNEDVKVVEANAEMERAQVEAAKAMRNKWYNPKDLVPASKIGRNVREKRADMDALVGHIAEQVKLAKKRPGHGRR